MNTLCTKAALPLFDASFEGPPNNRLEEYHPGDWIIQRGDSEETIYCLDDEAEAFEQDMQIALTADVIDDPRDYDAFVRYLVENYELAPI